MDYRPSKAMAPASPLLLDEDDTPLLWNEKTVEDRPAKKRRRRRVLYTLAAAATLVTCTSVAIYAAGGPPVASTSVIAAVEAAHEAVDSLHSAVVGTVDSLKDTTKAALAAVLPAGTILDDDAPRVDTQSEASLVELDTEVCGQSPCRFFVVGKVKEQESKAQLHLSQLAIVAASLNRTLVLPNMLGGRESTCYPHPFDLYHDPAAISELFDVPVLQWHDFERYTQRRKELSRAPTAQLLGVFAGGHTQGPTYRIDVKGGLKGCYGSAELDWSLHQDATLLTGAPGLTNTQLRQRYGDFIVDTLDSPDFIAATARGEGPKEAKPDVIFTMYGLTYRLFKAPAGQQYSGSEGPTLPFHPRWRKLADEIASSISPAIALHWRQEAVQNANFIPDFVQCARDAHAKLDSLRQGLKTVYFMTDFPLNNVSHSETYRQLLDRQPEYRVAAEAGIKEFYAWPGFTSSDEAPKLVTLDGMDLEVPLANGTRIAVRDLDTGLLGVIDKMVAERTEHYLVGEAQVCGRFSSFSAMVISQRKARQGHDGSLVQEPVLYFPKAGKKPYPV